MHSDELYFYQMGITAVLVSFKIHNSYLVNTMEYILRKREIKYKKELRGDLVLLVGGKL